MTHFRIKPREPLPALNGGRAQKSEGGRGWQKGGHGPSFADVHCRSGTQACKIPGRLRSTHVPVLCLTVKGRGGSHPPTLAALPVPTGPRPGPAKSHWKQKFWGSRWFPQSWEALEIKEGQDAQARWLPRARITSLVSSTSSCGVDCIVILSRRAPKFVANDE